MECHSRFPEGFPKNCLDQALAIVRGGDTYVRTSELSEHVWNLEGWCRAEGVGRPQTKADGGHGAEVITRAKALELLAEFEGELTKAANAGPDNPPSWADRGRFEWVQQAMVPGFLAALALLDRPAEEPQPA